MSKWFDYIRALEDMDCAEFQRQLDRTVDYVREARADKAKAFFIGNGGSAATALHFANDFQNAAQFPSMALADPATITCISNDYGYSSVYSDQLRHHARHGDLLFVLSASGESHNVLLAGESSKARGVVVITLSGFDPGNKLRQIGHVNFYVPHSHYGLVEQVHFTILHHILDRTSERRNHR